MTLAQYLEQSDHAGKEQLLADIDAFVQSPLGKIFVAECEESQKTLQMAILPQPTDAASILAREALLGSLRYIHRWVNFYETARELVLSSLD